MMEVGEGRRRGEDKGNRVSTQFFNDESITWQSHSSKIDLGRIVDFLLQTGYHGWPEEEAEEEEINISEKTKHFFSLEIYSEEEEEEEESRE